MEGCDRVEHVPIGLHELFQEDAGLCYRCYVDGMRGRVFWVENIAVCFELFAVQRIGAVAYASNATVIREVRGHQRIECHVNSALAPNPAPSVSDVHCTFTLKPSKPTHATCHLHIACILAHRPGFDCSHQRQSGSTSPDSPNSGHS